MKKFYTLLVLTLLLIPSSVFAANFPFWIGCYNGKIEIFSDSHYTNLVAADYGSEDGTDYDINSDDIADGLYIRITPDEGYILAAVDLLGEDFAGRFVNNCGHIALDELIDPEEGVYIMALCEEPLTLTFASSGHGTIKAYKDVDKTVELSSGVQVTPTDFYWGVYIEMEPENGYELETLVVNGEDVTAEVIDNISYILYDYNEDVNVSVTFAPSTAAIDQIGVDAAEAATEVFDLKGNRVNAGNAATGVYIIRQGDKTSKVLIKK